MIITEVEINSLTYWWDTEVDFYDTSEVIWEGSGTLIRSANRALADINYWQPVRMSDLTFRMKTEYGGYIDLSLGDIEFPLQMFNSANTWPPKDFIKLIIYFVPDTESNKIKLFECSGHRRSISMSTVTYDLYTEEYANSFLLTEISNGYGDGITNEKVLLPRSIGRIQHVEPVRLADISGNPTYHKAYVKGALCNYFTSVADNGSGKPRFTTNANHGFIDNDHITIEGVNRVYDGIELVVKKINDTTFDIESLTYSVDTSGYCFDDWDTYRIYDDGVPIPTNIIDDGGVAYSAIDTFHLNTNPVGEITISGTGQHTTLAEVVQWACNADKLNLVYDGTYAESPSPDIYFFADSQEKVIDFISDICAYHTHIVYVVSGSLYLIDMSADYGSVSLTNYDYIKESLSVNKNKPVALLKAEWDINEAVEETSGKFIKSKSMEANSVEGYIFGDKENISPYHNDKSTISGHLDSLIAKKNQDLIKLEMPLVTATLPVPGKKYTFTNTNFIKDLTCVFHARNITYSFDPNNEKVTVEGEGTISA